ncbi:serine hydrolase [Labrys okinawensis]|uniref:serine hydrolase n=1 Tax=Labrys okinawensis TaxID=346911 RepID=UPI0039BCE227
MTEIESCPSFAEANAGVLEFEGVEYLDGRTSDPRELGWMLGAPPALDKRITVESDTYFDFPQNRWSLSHIRELLPTVNVWRGQSPSSRLKRSDRSKEIDALTFRDAHGRSRRFEEALFDTYTDGIVVLHNGTIVYERYFGALKEHLPHSCYSVTKSYAGTLAAALVHEGVLNGSRPITHYISELRGTGWEGATLRQVMDMHTSLAHTEEYLPGDRSSVCGVSTPLILRCNGQVYRLRMSRELIEESLTSSL